MTLITQPSNIKNNSQLYCSYCGENQFIDMDEYNDGFWCEVCDGYTGINGKHSFCLVLEEKSDGNTIQVMKKRFLKKQISPIRYPGGKSRLIDYIYDQLDMENMQVFIEPYVGGGSVGLSLLEAGVIGHLAINDLDYGIYSLFNTIKTNKDELIKRIKNANLKHEDYFLSQQIVKNKYKGKSEIDAAWHFLVVNRLSYSGIYNANPLGGKNGNQRELLQRWNSGTLVKRIELIHSMSHKVSIYNKDALDLIEEYYWRDNATMLIDPPYYLKGKDLYNHYYIEDDHRNLALLLESLHYGCKGADIILTYDNNSSLSSLYQLPKKQIIKRVYSI